MQSGGPQFAIDFRSVVKQFGDRRAVDGLTLRVARGEVFGLLGPNGSGKTTTVNLLTGLSKLSHGSVHVLGHDISTQAKKIRARVGAVPQETALYEELTAEHNLRIHADLYFVPKGQQDKRIAAVLELVHLADRADSRVRTFSGGMKRRLALARALLHDPELIVLDEPTLGVDIQSRQALWDHILHLKTLGKTVLITTNYLEEADALCDRLAILDHGRVVALNSPEVLRNEFGTTHLVVKVNEVPGHNLLAYLDTVPGVIDVAVAAQEIVVRIAGNEEAGGHCLTAIAQTRRIMAIEYRLPSLDSVKEPLEHCDVVVNCTGLGSRTLCQDDRVYPIRGQVMRVRPVGLDDIVVRDTGPDTPAFAVPRIHDTLLGGTAQEHDWNTDVDPKDTADILTKCAELSPLLKDVEIIDEIVGLRPARDQVRLEAEEYSDKLVIHNYGHGGAGFTLSWGCASDVVEIARNFASRG